MSDATDINNALSMDRGWGPAYSALTAAKQAQIDTWRLSGFRQVYSPPILPGQKIAHEWSFLKPRFDITTNAPYSTGTVAVTAGAVVLTGGTWPTWAANGDLVVDGKTVEVRARNSGTALTLADTIDVTAGTTYNLVCSRYTLPDGFAGLIGPLVFRPGEAVENCSLQFIGEFQIADMRSRSDAVNRPKCFSIQREFGGTGGYFTFVLLLYPVPDAVYSMIGRCRINPGDNIVNGDDYFELFLESCLAVGESRSLDNSGIHMQRFMQMLTAAISLDKAQTVPEYLGIDSDRSTQEREGYLNYYPELANSAGVIGTYTDYNILGT